MARSCTCSSPNVSSIGGQRGAASEWLSDNTNNVGTCGQLQYFRRRKSTTVATSHMWILNFSSALATYSPAAALSTFCTCSLRFRIGFTAVSTTPSGEVNYCLPYRSPLLIYSTPLSTHRSCFHDSSRSTTAALVMEAGPWRKRRCKTTYSARITPADLHALPLSTVVPRIARAHDNRRV